MSEDWVVREILNVLCNLPQPMHRPVGEALMAASSTTDVWMPGLLALLMGVLLACVWVLMTYMGGDDDGRP